MAWTYFFFFSSFFFVFMTWHLDSKPFACQYFSNWYTNAFHTVYNWPFFWDSFAHMFFISMYHVDNTADYVQSVKCDNVIPCLFFRFFVTINFNFLPLKLDIIESLFLKFPVQLFNVGFSSNQFLMYTLYSTHVIYTTLKRMDGSLASHSTPPPQKMVWFQNVRSSTTVSAIYVYAYVINTVYHFFFSRHSTSYFVYALDLYISIKCYFSSWFFIAFSF